MTRFVFASAAAALVLAGCDAASPAPPAASTVLTPAEQEVAASIVAQSLSDRSDGLMSSMNDMGGQLDLRGLSFSDGMLGMRFGGRAWRPFGDRQPGRVTFDSTSGTWRLVYDRSVDAGVFKKTMKADVTYRYEDAAGAVVRDPRANRARVDKVAYTGTREGSETVTPPVGAPAGHFMGGTMSRSFKSTGAWTFAGLTGPTATFTGQQADEGAMTVARPDSTPVTTTYTATLRSQNVTLTKANATAGVEAAVKGQLLYAVTMTITRQGQAPVTKTTEGTLELDGNGAALMRFAGLNQSLYRIDLRDGGHERRDR